MAVADAGVAGRAREGGRPLGGRGFDWTMACLGLALAAGIYLDGWAHSTGKVDASFFTPWHAVLYSAMLVSGAFLAASAAGNAARGAPWRRALPAGYGLSAVGVALFFAGGCADLVWHELFGIEANAEALYSPTHLLLGFSAFLIVGGPFRAAWQRSAGDGVTGWAEQLPVVLSLLALYSGCTFFTQDVHWITGLPGGRPPGGALSEYRQLLGLAGVLLQTALLMGFVLLAVLRWRLAPGTLTLFVGLNALGMSFQDRDWRSDLVVAAVAGGVAADVLLRLIRPTAARPGAVRAFAVAVPVAFYAAYFLVLRATVGIWWS